MVRQLMFYREGGKKGKKLCFVVFFKSHLQLYSYSLEINNKSVCDNAVTNDVQCQTQSKMQIYFSVI